MTHYIIKILLSAAAVWFGTAQLPNVSVTDYKTAVLVAFGMSVLNTFLKPILKFLGFPITVFTLGLFLLVINVIIVYAVAHFIKGFRVSGFTSPLIFSFGFSLFTWLLGVLLDSNED